MPQTRITPLALMASLLRNCLRRTPSSVRQLILLTGLLIALPAHALAADKPIADTPNVDQTNIEVDAVEDVDPPISFESLLDPLAKASFSEKEKVVDMIVEEKFSGSRKVLAAFLDNALYFDAQTGQVLIISESEGQEDSYFDAISGDALSGYSGDAKKIRTNNGLRKKLRGAIARFDLDDDNAVVRLGAIKQLRDDPDDEIMPLLREQLKDETNEEVIEQLTVTLAIFDLNSDDADVRLSAVQRLDGELGNDVYNRIKILTEEEQDSQVKSAALSVMTRIEGKRSFYAGLETTFFGLSFGSVLVLSAIGLAITFGVMGVINMAHGELMMLGAYTTFVIQQMMPDHIGLSILLSIPAAFLVSGLVGIAIERGIVRFLYGRPLETLLATFGVSLILQQVVRSIFSPLNRSVQTPEMMSGLLRINEIFAITYNRLYILIFTLIVFAGLLLILNRTSLGLKVRAVSQNRQMAKAIGVRTDRVDALTFGLGSGVAGIAGVALSQLTNVGPNLGQSYIIDSFMVVVFGGVGNLWGTLIAGFGLGIFNKILEPYAGAVLAKIFILVFIILFIQRRKQGLFPQKGRAAEDH
ncbi:MAG: urea ABC transporter permease subunit UrtB [Alcanivoracaceae bacterium]|nr:urea ABC transporter permease subunit UrtB [Alcanivoracaceae bacterium]